MSRKMIQIDESKCVGCGLCANACQQSAIVIINGKAKLTHEQYCDGLGNCLPVCPVDAISFSDKDIINTHIDKKPVASCPNSQSHVLENRNTVQNSSTTHPSMLKQWPVQIKLAPLTAHYFNNAHLLVAADCCAYAYANFHNDFMRNKATLIGCPKLDGVNYTDKLLSIIKNNTVKSCTIIRMEVPCCSGLEKACVEALKNSGKFIPWQVITISTTGNILD